MKLIFSVLIVASLFVAPMTYAQNKPCSGKKGGILHCSGGKFICSDGSTSKSKKVCG